MLAFFGDGASSQGDVNEAFVWARPLTCRSSTSARTTSGRSPRRSTPDPGAAVPAARGFGFPGVRVDGNDVLAVLAVTREALDRARNGQGPTLIEA